jgi:D-alanyl-lipoteichoic acid acyltransferase DltB (MBOAT superfamily)
LLPFGTGTARSTCAAKTRRAGFVAVAIARQGRCFLSEPGRPARPAQPDAARRSCCGRRHSPGAYTMALASLNLWQNTEQLNCTSREVKGKITNRPSHELEAIGLWLISFALVAVLSQLLFSLYYFNWELFSKVIYKSLVSSLVCVLIVLAVLAFDQPKKHLLKYILFFAITITSALGLTKTLTGSHAQSDTIFLYGFSFYTASIAYLLHSKQLSAKSIATCSNPLLLITGPIATCFGSMHHYSFKKRFKYFFPYILVGLFLHQAIATPLTKAFHLIALTDMISSCAYAVIFELFVYANFCGLSLMIYGVCGIIGVRIPLNFRQPFSSTNIVEYWRGWHTSLSTVLKSLFYTPTKRSLGTFPAIFVVYLASAMWHGVTINFVLWGVFHASVFILTIVFLRKAAFLPSFVLMIAGVLIGRALFADSDFPRLLEKLSFKYDGFVVLTKLAELPNTSKLALLLGIFFIVAEMVFQKCKYFKKRNYKFYRIPIIQLILLVSTLGTICDDSGLDYAVYGQR